MSLFYTEWCDKHGLCYDNEQHKAAWLKWSEEEMRKPRPTPMPFVDNRVMRTWKDDREAELQRRSYRIFYKIIWPPPMPLVSFPSLADNPWLGYHGWD